MNGTRPPPFRLVGTQISDETVQALEQLLAQARRGELVGLAFCGMYRQRRYVVSTAGEARRNPTFALAMTRVLDFKLCKKIVGTRG